MRVRLTVSGVLGCLILAGTAAPASAQSSTSPLFRHLRFNAPAAATLPSPAVGLHRPAAPRQAGDPPINAIVFGGLNTGYGDAGFAVGGGVQVDNLADREEFGLQFDALFSNAGECLGCNRNDDFSARQLAVAGAFLYRFRETPTGWRPFAGGGVLFTHFSFSLGNDFICDIVNVDCSDSISEVGLQAQGGVTYRNLQFEGRVQGTAGGAFIGLVGYRFGR